MNAKGFTLIELIAVMIIIGILATVAVSKFVSIDDRAEVIMVESGITELNAREKLAWLDYKLSDSELSVDEYVLERVDTDLGGGFRWDGPFLVFRSTRTKLERVEATEAESGYWELAGSGKGKGKGKKPKGKGKKK